MSEMGFYNRMLRRTFKKLQLRSLRCFSNDKLREKELAEENIYFSKEDCTSSIQKKSYKR